MRSSLLVLASSSSMWYLGVMWAVTVTAETSYNTDLADLQVCSICADLGASVSFYSPPVSFLVPCDCSSYSTIRVIKTNGPIDLRDTSIHNARPALCFVLRAVFPDNSFKHRSRTQLLCSEHSQLCKVSSQAKGAYLKQLPLPPPPEAPPWAPPPLAARSAGWLFCHSSQHPSVYSSPRNRHS